MDLVDQLQLIALPLEIIGFILVALELFKNEVVTQLQKQIDRFPTYFTDLRFNESDREAILDRDNQNWSTQAGCVKLVVFMVYVIIVWPFVRSMEHWWSIVFAVIISYMFLNLFLFLFSLLLVGITHFLNQLTNGNAIGGLGLLLALTGIIFESVQIWLMPHPIYVVIF